MNLKRALGLAVTLLLIVFGVGTVSAQGGDAARGAPVFAKNCAVCHGSQGQGRVGATLSKDFPALRVNTFLQATITNGVPGTVMSAWAKDKGGPLSDAEIQDVVAYIQSLSGAGAPAAPSAPAGTRAPLPTAAPNFPAGEATRGTKVYADNCAVCHGERGEGRIGATLQKDFPGIDPEKFLDATIARGVAGSRMPAWAKFAGGPLSEQEIADAAAFIRSLKRAPAPAQPAPPTPTGGAFGGWLALACVVVIAFVGVGALILGLAGTRKNPV